MKIHTYLLFGILFLAINACQDKDIERENVKIATLAAESINGELNVNDFIWTWPENEHFKMQVTLYADGSKSGNELVDGNQYIHKSVDTNIEYTYVFKLTDGVNFSNGIVKKFIREGAEKITGITMTQIEKEGGYDALLEWNKSVDAESIMLEATNGTRSIQESLEPNSTSFLIQNVAADEIWQASLTAKNVKGNSLATTVSLKIGKTTIGFLSAYATPEELLQNGDDDEASAWLWLKNEYKSAEYLYFGNITSTEQLQSYRVLFWLRDLEGVNEDAVWNMPQAALDALPFIKSWYTDGGSLLLWSHAVPYITNLGRIDGNLLRTNDRAIGVGRGEWNGDTWAMAVQIHPGSKFKKDFSSHPIYKGLDVISNDRTKLISFKGAGWTEDHNCLFFNLPSILTGLGNQEESCYNILTNQYGIYPLGIWDSQIDWVSQLNVWEAQQGNTEFKGTILCIGNGGCEFSMRNPDGTPDISAYPQNNVYQDNVLKLAKNSLEYLKTR